MIRRSGAREREATSTYGDLGRAVGEFGALLSYILQKIQEHELRIGRLARQRARQRRKK